MRRISVVGTPGAGKSTVAGELARNLAVPFVELDGIVRLPSRAAVRRFLAGTSPGSAAVPPDT